MFFYFIFIGNEKYKIIYELMSILFYTKIGPNPIKFVWAYIKIIDLL